MKQAPSLAPVPSAQKPFVFPDVVKSIGTVIGVFIVGTILSMIAVFVIALLSKWTATSLYQLDVLYAALPKTATWALGLGGVAMSITGIRDYNLLALIVGGALAGLFGIILAAQDKVDDSMLIGGVVLGTEGCALVTGKKV